MRKFEVNKEKKKLSPTEEQIRRQKDFSRLHHEYEHITKRGKKKLYQDPKLLLLIIIIGIILLLLFLDEL